jgi:hypothetical protein
MTFTSGHHTLLYDDGNWTDRLPDGGCRQNDMHAVIYTYIKGPLIISPYFQYGNCRPTDGWRPHKPSATGGAINVSCAFKNGFRFRGAARMASIRATQSTDRHYAGLLGVARQHLHRDANLSVRGLVRSRRSGGYMQVITRRKCVWLNRSRRQPIWAHLNSASSLAKT